MNLNKYMFATLVVIFALLMIGIGLSAYDSTKGSHDTLWTNFIEPKSGDTVVVSGNMQVTGTLTSPSLTSGGSGGTTAPAPVITCAWEGWAGGLPQPGYSRWECRFTGVIRLYCQAGRVTQADTNGCGYWQEIST